MNDPRRRRRISGRSQQLLSTRRGRVNERRQGEPHPHSAKTDPSGKFILIPDLGQDKVRIYRIGKDGQSMQPNDPAYATMPPGGGPRHVSFFTRRNSCMSIMSSPQPLLSLKLDENTGANQKPFRRLRTCLRDLMETIQRQKCWSIRTANSFTVQIEGTIVSRPLRSIHVKVNYKQPVTVAVAETPQLWHHS